MNQDAIWHGRRSRPRTHCFSFRPMSTVATVAHLSYCWALVITILTIACFTNSSYCLPSRLCSRTWTGSTMLIFFVTARIELRKVLFLAPSVCVLCSCMKYLGNRWTDLHQIHKDVVFGSSLRSVWRSSSKVKDQGYQGQKGICRPFRRSACGLCLVKHL